MLHPPLAGGALLGEALDLSLYVIVRHAVDALLVLGREAGQHTLDRVERYETNFDEARNVRRCILSHLAGGAYGALTHQHHVGRLSLCVNPGKSADLALPAGQNRYLAGNHAPLAFV